MSLSSQRRWQFWIDVGGTFTDCIGVRPDGAIVRKKLLSSGVIQGKTDDVSSCSVGACSVVIDSSRRGETPDLWRGYEIVLYDDNGSMLARRRVVASEGDQGRLTLDSPLASPAPVGVRYELRSAYDAPIVAIRLAMGLSLDAPIPPIALRLGTTRGTNALLTRTGAKTALLTTQGFGDLLEIGYQDRPRLYDLAVTKPLPLAYRTVEIAERIAADGRVLLAPDPETIRAQLADLRAEGCESVAICFLHADLFPAHEQLVGALAREAGFDEVVCSCDAARVPKIVARAETTVADAYLQPVLRSYLSRLQSALPASSIRLMTSAGGLCPLPMFRGCESILSGPAGGVVGYARASEAAGFARAIGFDMGGTSTDVSRYDGTMEIEYESRKAGIRLMVPTLAIETIAAGGGSLCWFDGVRLRVGRQSAGADPGPACYGRGGPLTITDVNCFLGRIPVNRFPFPLSLSAVEARLAALAGELASAGERLSCESLAFGLLRIANANMAHAIRNITVAKGCDPRDYVLTAFGGAAGQHACAVADEIGVKTILDPHDAGVLSARGIGQADVVRHATCSLSQRAELLSDQAILTTFSDLENVPRAELRDEGFTEGQILVRRSLEVRYAGVDASIDVPWALGEPWRQTFEAFHKKEYGYVHFGRAIEATAGRVVVRGVSIQPCSAESPAKRRQASIREAAKAWFGGRFLEAPLYDRAALRPGDWLVGPAVVAGPHATFVVEPGWEVELLSQGDLLAKRLAPKPSEVLGAAKNDASAGGRPIRETAEASSAAVMTEIFQNLLAGIAERMGRVLQRTALSVNVKERLDFSCALFTGEGDLIANAPHVPVHLGAMGATVRAVMRDNPALQPGDVYLTNDPYAGGSHLPDLTIIAPIFAAEAMSPTFFTAVRAHHAEIGGMRPGSMPPFSTRLEEEGVILSNFLLVRDGVLRAEALRNHLASPPYPSRAIDENLADVRAQVAAARQGANDLKELVSCYGLEQVLAQVRAVQSLSETLVRRAIDRLSVGPWSFVDQLELPGGATTPLAVHIDRFATPSGPALRIDFTGSGPVVPGNLNANEAIVSAAVLYVLRLLVAEEVPINEGALRAVELVVPPGLLNPHVGAERGQAPAVAAGNVETSQRLVDVLLGALGLAAASQGTMNNLIFGNAQFGCYETIGGGSGAINGAQGADAVQVHMTNTRATDPEILERRLPVRLWEFAVRRGSGGRGRWRGGDGMVRRIEFLAPVDLSIISQRRGNHRPYGMAGGLPGAAGANYLLRADGSRENLAGIAAISAASGDQVVLLTPGGGGYGRPSEGADLLNNDS